MEPPVGTLCFCREDQDSCGTLIEPGSEIVNTEKSSSFSKLPLEIRLRIWKIFHDDHGPRAITLHHNPKSGFYSKSAPPATFSVNRESRTEALGYFTHAFTKHMINGVQEETELAHVAPVYVNFSKDVIYLQSAEKDAIIHLLKAMSASDLGQLRYLATNDVTWPCGSSENLIGIVEAVVSMSNLQRLSVVKIDAWFVWDEMTEYEMQEVLLRGPGLRGVWQDQGSTLSNYLWAMEWRKEREPTWRMPAVHIVCNNELIHMRGVHIQRSLWCHYNGDARIILLNGRRTIHPDYEVPYLEILKEFRRKHPHIKIAGGRVEGGREAEEQA